jgi:hypothetical protein
VIVMTRVDLPAPTVRTAVPMGAMSGPARRMTERLLLHSPPAPTRIYEPSMLDDLPGPARRWLGRAIVPGVVMPHRAWIWMRGEIKVGDRWHDFTAEQLLVPDSGFVWAARCRWGPIDVAGYDAYARGSGRMHWTVLGVPVLSRSDGDVTRSALDRFAAESTLLPTSLLDVPWWHISQPDSAVYLHRVRGRYARARVTIRVADDGRLLGVRMRRWGAPNGGPYGVHAFAVDFAGEFRAGAVRVPDGISAAWPDDGGEFFRARLDRVELE